VVASALTFILYLASFRNAQPRSIVPTAAGAGRDVLDKPGHAIAGKLGNETAKAELGRAAWKLMHTTFARFPEHPSASESSALRTYVHLFQRLYPCGECAEHFATVLKQYPPQVSSRKAAVAWGCHVHNEVNKQLGKKVYDCARIGEEYDCGCAEGEKKGEKERGKRKRKRAEEWRGVEMEIVGPTQGA